MLDTNIIAYLRNNKPEEVRKRFLKLKPGEICISSITYAELFYGICKSSKPEVNRFALLNFLSAIEILPFDDLAAEEYGRIRFDLKQKGNLIGANDLLIAAHAKSRNIVLVTNNTKEFERVQGLRLENWVA
jgi:tRNA(fMet)-specific endonuclease VapC